MKKHKGRLQSQVRELLRAIDEVNEAENARYGDRDLEELGEEAEPITAEQLDRKVKEMEERLAQKKVEPKDGDDADSASGLKKAVKRIRKDYLPRLKKYEKQEEILGDRNSYSKTDEDATFLRMKDDHMRNGQLKPGYNVQITTEQQFITNYTLHANPTDTRTLPSHLDHFHALYGHHPEVVVADAGYGSVENYRDMETRGSTAYVKYNSFDQEQRRRRKDSALRHSDFVYDGERDQYTCPAGKMLAYHHSRKRRTKDGEVTETRIYEAEECVDCALRSRCCPQQEKRRLYINELVERYRRETRELLNGAQGKIYRSRRMIEAESVFGQIKHNRAFRRFRLRGMENVKTEFGLIAIAHNLAKWWTQTLPCPD